MMNELSIEREPSLQPSRLRDELRAALVDTPSSDLAEWGKRSAKRFPAVGAKRTVGFGKLLVTITSWTADQVADAVKTCRDRGLPEYARGQAESAKSFGSRVLAGGQSVFDHASKLLRSKPEEAATHMLAVVIGFYCGSGGDGDGGIPDLDLMAGIGAHRSILTHSIIAGMFVETTVMSLVDLVHVVHTHLPEGHSDFWDRLLRHTELGGDTFVSGASIGIATHLGVDTVLDGFTPYKDLPISLPASMHEFLLGLNAAVEGTHGVRRYGESMDNLRGKTANHAEPATDYIVKARQHDHRATLGLHLAKPKTMEPQPVSRMPEELQQTNDVFAPALNVSRQVEQLLCLDASKVRQAVEQGQERIRDAAAPFRLGVVGEFRVGKSTLINALLGQEIAFTDFMEATPVICRFTKGEELKATICHKNGSEESIAVDACNRSLDQRRHDADWVSSIERVDYHVPSDALDAFDLWDAPGLGGSDENDNLAQRFVDMLGGGVWVVDATLVGKAAVAGPILRMHEDGKPVMCVLNRIDETDVDPQELMDWVNRSYPDVFEDIVTFSALDAIESAHDGNLSDAAGKLWETIHAALGSDISSACEIRQKQTTVRVMSHVATELHGLRREIQDRLGAIAHSRSDIEEAKRRTLEQMPERLSESSEKAFKQLAQQVEGELERSKWSVEAIDRAKSVLTDPASLNPMTQKILDQVWEDASRRWTNLANRAMNLTKAAVPIEMGGSTVTSRPMGAMDDRAVEQGIYTGGMTAIGLATLAAVSTIVTWPVILASLPVGALAAWKKTRDTRPDAHTMMIEIQNLVAALKQRFVQEIQPKIEANLDDAVQQQIESILDKEADTLLNGTSEKGASELLCQIRTVALQLNDSRDGNEQEQWDGQDVLEALEDSGTRLDMIVPDLDFSLAPILSRLSSETMVRLIFNGVGLTREDRQKKVTEAFGNWPGKKRVRAITAGEGIQLETILSTQDLCLASVDRIGRIQDRGTTFRAYIDGRLAGQHLFAGLWEGAPFRGIRIEVVSVH